MTKAPLRVISQPPPEPSIPHQNSGAPPRVQEQWLHPMEQVHVLHSKQPHVTNPPIGPLP
eukprot:885123-Ditylum_brightwellii.AAC.1